MDYQGRIEKVLRLKRLQRKPWSCILKAPDVSEVAVEMTRSGRGRCEEQVKLSRDMNVGKKHVTHDLIQ